MLKSCVHSLLEGRDTLVVAIDGRSGAGKTTLATALAEKGHCSSFLTGLWSACGVVCDNALLSAWWEKHLEALTASEHTKKGAAVIHMDDFFLPASKKLEKPSEVPFDYERFMEEVLPFLPPRNVRLRGDIPNIYQSEKRGYAPFTYRIYNCTLGDFSGVRQVTASPFYIVEGAYSCHPILGDYMDFRIFCDIDADLQIKRIEARNGKEKAAEFANKWIPMEEEYFGKYDIKAKADLVIQGGKSWKN
ncbi:MAG: hypothetical protein FWG87_00915 [Defluviitaleaceae bacterium]|nr:hypothetical protein [Defluviitaleaceae bacterium]